MRRILIAAMCVSLLVAGLPAGAAAQSQSSGEASAYAGAHVSFNVSESAVTDYQVGGNEMLASVEARSAASVRGEVETGASLDAVTAIAGSALSVESRTSAQAHIGSEESAEMTAHDNGHGVLLVEASEEQYVVANLSEGASAESESDSRVAVTTENGTEGTFIVVGEGEVAVNENGNVSAELGSESRLVFRSYPEQKDEADERQETLIQNGTATAEVYAMEQDGETVFDTVTYAEDTTVTATERSESAVNVTVERASSTGTVVITSVSEAVVESADDAQVYVDGEAAAEASTYSELRGAIGGDSSRYTVASEGAASARTDVLVGVNHFSERSMSIQSADGANGSGGAPGFGAGVTLAALGALAFFARYRR